MWRDYGVSQKTYWLTRGEAVLLPFFELVLVSFWMGRSAGFFFQHCSSVWPRRWQKLHLILSLRSRAVMVVVIPMSVSLKLMALTDGDSSPLALAVRTLSWILQGDRDALRRDGLDMIRLREGKVGLVTNNLKKCLRRRRVELFSSVRLKPWIACATRPTKLPNRTTSRNKNPENGTATFVKLPTRKDLKSNVIFVNVSATRKNNAGRRTQRFVPSKRIPKSAKKR